MSSLTLAFLLVSLQHCLSKGSVSQPLTTDYQSCKLHGCYGTKRQGVYLSYIYFFTWMDSEYTSYVWTLNYECHTVEIDFCTGMNLGYTSSTTRGVWGLIFFQRNV